jgi:hypothetical protein
MWHRLDLKQLLGDYEFQLAFLDKTEHCIRWSSTQVNEQEVIGG